MKPLAFLIFLLTSFSCQEKTETHDSFEALALQAQLTLMGTDTIPMDTARGTDAPAQLLLYNEWQTENTWYDTTFGYVIFFSRKSYQPQAYVAAKYEKVTEEIRLVPQVQQGQNLVLRQPISEGRQVRETLRVVYSQPSGTREMDLSKKYTFIPYSEMPEE